jgi:hypothetical protein
MTDPLSQPLTVLKTEDAIRWLEGMLEFYSGQELEYYNKLWGPSAEPTWSRGTESEWMRYRQEAAALRMGIEAIRTVSAGAGQ